VGRNRARKERERTCVPAASLREKESHQSAASGGGIGAVTPAGRAFSGCRFRRLAPLSGAMTRVEIANSGAEERSTKEANKAACCGSK
jgi:hypothetical protein